MLMALQLLRELVLEDTNQQHVRRTKRSRAKHSVSVQS
jgi:hypothetical protein